ncbi:hypothetical protein BD779DRAFT_1477437 [Infundibulicybe gibba]|nr:hypothetical protein BD779DRAFT_1477437 [Infundibulicybe gibba]
MPNLRVFCPMDRWDSFRWPPSSLTSSFLQLNALNLTLISAMVEDDLREFLRPFQWLAKLYLPQLDPLTGAALRELSSGALIPSVTSIVFGPIGIEGLIFILEERLVVSQAAGSGISMFTFVSSACIRPTDPGLVARLEVLEATGIQLTNHSEWMHSIHVRLSASGNLWEKGMIGCDIAIVVPYFNTVTTPL